MQCSSQNPVVMIGNTCHLEKVAVIGAGAFGTAIATLAARNGHQVFLYARDPKQASAINETRRNPKHLSEFELPNTIQAVSSIDEALADTTIILLTLPAQMVPEWLSENKEKILPKALICNTAKGLYLKERRLLSDAVTDALGRDQPYAVLSGPSFALEIMQQMPTAVVVASKYQYHAITIQRVLASSIFMVYTSQDVIGVELGGALKNPLAIGAGIIQGLGLGVNTMAAYVTRSSLELQQLCRAMGGEAQTISGLSGVGDLMLTAFGELSRNRSLGRRLTGGETVDTLTHEMTVEGVPTALVAVHLADRCGLDLPIFRAVAAILSGHLSAKEAPLHLLGRPGMPEIYNSQKR
eukprot:gene3172-6257_t